MADNILNQIKDHLGFLGYSVTSVNEDSISAKHQQKFNFVCKKVSSGFHFSIYMSDCITNKKEKLLESINLLNSRTMFSCYFLDKENSLIMTAWYPYIYEKEQFGLFIDLFNQDCIRVGAEDLNMKEFYKS